ncbi:Cysteine protease [Entamoeba marina]
MKSPLFKGIVGGIGDSAIYIFGSQQQRVFFLDPHYVQNYGDFGYFSPKIYQSDVLRLDSSMVIGMFANNEKEQNDIRELFNMSDKEHQIKEVTNITEMDGFEVLDFD